MTFSEIFEEVKKEMNDNKISYQEIANKTGYSKQTVYNIINMKAGTWKKAEVILKNCKKLVDNNFDL